MIKTKKISAWRNPTKSEIKFGHGAIHHRDFEGAEFFKWLKPGGSLKRWIVCPHDGLRYYRSMY